MRPVDPRLLRRSASARRYVATGALLSAAEGGLLIGQALLLAAVVAPVAVRGAGLSDVAVPLAGLGAVLGGRVLHSILTERVGSRAALEVAAGLRRDVVRAALTRPGRTGPVPDTSAASEVTALVTTGLAGLDGYLTRFLPHLLATAVVTPAALAVVLGLDLVAALTLAVVLPLVPLFMALVGWTTQTATRHRLVRMQRLGAEVLDLVAGLATLRAFGRARAQADLVRRLGAGHRDATMRTLRIAFLSAFVLELLTTIGVALVAVGVGFRLAYGQLDLATGLAVLVLAPEVLAPLRRVGADFHASADGLAALERVMALLDVPGGSVAPGAVASSGARVDLTSAPLRVRGFAAVDREGRPGPATDLDLAPGEIVALAGPSGSGKTSLVSAVLGLLPLDGRAATGTIHLGGVPLADCDMTAVHRQVAWLPQRPTVQPGTLADNVLLWADPGRQDGREAAGEVRAGLDRAAALSGLDEVVSGLPDGWDTRVGEGGVGLSAGQRQRLALTRVLLRPAPLLLLDEPSAHLDAVSADRLAAVLAQARAAGRTVLVVSHRPAVHRLVDRVVTTGSGDHPAPQGPDRPGEADLPDAAPARPALTSGPLA